MVPKLADFGLARGVPRSEKSRVKNMLLGGGVWKTKKKWFQSGDTAQRSFGGVQVHLTHHHILILPSRGTNMKSRDCRTFCGTWGPELGEFDVRS